MEVLIPVSTDYEVQPVRKILNAQSMPPIEILISCARSMATHGSMVNTSPAGVQLGGVCHPPYSPDLVPSDFHLFLHLKKFLSSQCQSFQNDREVIMSVTVVPIPGSRLLYHMIQKFVPRYDKCLNPGRT